MTDQTIHLNDGFRLECIEGVWMLMHMTNVGGTALEPQQAECIIRLAKEATACAEKDKEIERLRERVEELERLRLEAASDASGYHDARDEIKRLDAENVLLRDSEDRLQERVEELGGKVGRQRESIRFLESERERYIQAHGRAAKRARERGDEIARLEAQLREVESNVLGALDRMESDQDDNPDHPTPERVKRQFHNVVLMCKDAVLEALAHAKAIGAMKNE